MKSLCRGLSIFTLGLALGGGAVFAAFHWHVVRADDGWHWVRNDASSLTDCYADVRGWTAEDWAARPKVASALVNAGKGDLILRTSASGTIDRLLNRQ